MKKTKMADDSERPGPSHMNINVNIVNSPELTSTFNPVTNCSAEKLSCNSLFIKIDEGREKVLTRQSCIDYGKTSKQEVTIQPVSGHSLINLVNLNNLLFQAAICSNCKNKNSHLQMYENVNKRKGLAQIVFTKCSYCAHVVEVCSSSTDGNCAYDTNIKSVHAACHGMGYAGLKKVSASLDLPEPVSKKPLNNICKNLSKASFENAATYMKNLGDKLFNSIQQEDPENIELSDTLRADVAVSVDGTWQKRGHTSRIGAVFIISIDTGEVLDFIVKRFTIWLICYIEWFDILWEHCCLVMTLFIVI